MLLAIQDRKLDFCGQARTLRHESILLQQVCACACSCTFNLLLTLSDRPFMRVDAVTPESNYSNYTDPRSFTPHTPSTQITSPGSMMSRKPSPPSPEMRLPFDNPFPVFPSEKFQSQSPDVPRKPTTPLQGESRFGDPKFMKPAKSPGAQILKRMDTIAAGPFGGSSMRPSQREPGPGANRGPSNGSVQKQFRNSKGREHFRRPSTSQSHRSERSNPYELPGLPRSQPDDEQVSSRPGPEQPSRSDEVVDRFLNQLQSEAESTPSPMITPASRSRTFAEGTRPRLPGPTPVFRIEDSAIPPLRSQMNQQPYNQPLQSAGLERPKYNPYGYDQPQPSPGSIFGSARPRSKSFGSSANHVDRRRPDEPPVPPMPGVARTDSDKSTTTEVSHSTSDSSSSGYSVASNARSQASSNTSWSDDREDRSLSGARRNRSNTNRSIEESKSSQPPLPEPRFPIPPPLDSPIDPAIQFGLGSAPRKRSNTNASSSSSSSMRYTPPRDRQRLHDRSGSRDQKSDVPLPQRTPTTRGMCASCRAPILVGEKSVKDSTRRLTGRYHKSCFVCRHCSSPFPTGEFYVHTNAPYCARHWHEVNGSLCKGCDNGIEGTYLETDRREKFHQGCFRCTTCRSKLDEEYFEFEGKPFCERHSWAFGPRNNGALGVPGGGIGMGGRYGRSPEKRRTRLMNMM